MRNAKRSMQSFSFADSAECVTKKRAEGDSHTQRGLSGGSVSLCRLMSTCRPQCARCLLRLSLLFSSSLSLFYMLPFLLAFLFFSFFFLAEIPHVFKQKRKKANVTIWGLHMEKPDSAQLLCFSHRESTLLVKLSAKWCTC